MTADCPSASDLAARLAQRRADWLPRCFPAGKLRAGVFELGDADGAAGRSFPIPLRGHPGLVDFGGDSLPGRSIFRWRSACGTRNYRLIDVDKNGDLPDRPHIEPFVIHNIAIGREADETPITCGVAVVITMIRSAT